MYWLKESIKDNLFIFIDVDGTIRDTLRSMVTFAKEHGDQLISDKPILFKSGMSFEKYYHEFPQIAANAPVVAGSQDYIRRFYSILGIKPFYISTQKTEIMQSITKTWLQEYGFLKDEEVYFTQRMLDKDGYIGSLELGYKPILIDDWNFPFMRYATHFRIDISGEGKYNWNEELYDSVKKYYDNL